MAFSWSYSRLNSFEICPRRYYEITVAKSVVDKPNAQQGEGLVTHKALELNVLRGQPLPQELRNLEPLMYQLKAAPGQIYAEQKLALDANFQPCGWKDWDVAWCRAVIDVMKIHDDAAFAGDYKTGKPKFESDQLKLTAAVVFHHHPMVQKVTTAFLWLNHPTARPTTETYWREALPVIWQDFLPRVERLQIATTQNKWPERPNGLCRQHCPVTGCKHHGKSR